MAREITISFGLGATLKGGFKGVFSSAAASVANVSNAVRAMENSPVGKLGASMVAQRQKIVSLAGSMRQAQSTLTGLQNQAAAAGGATGILARQISLAQGHVNSLNAAMQRQLGTWRNTVAQATTTSGSVNRLTQDYARLERQMSRMRNVQTGLSANRAQADALRAQRGDLNSRLTGTMAAAATVAVPAKLSIDFEQSIANVGAVANASDEDLKKLTDTARQLGRDTMFSASEAAEGMKYLAMAGFSTEQTISAMPGMLDLAAAANTDLGRTADIASDILTAFGLKATDMGQVANTLAKAFTSGNTDLSMLGDTMKYVGPVAASLGMSLQDTSGYAVALANAGIKASQGGTVLRAAMLRVASPPKASKEALGQLTGLEGEELDKLQEELGESAEALAKLGMATKDSQGNMRPFVDIIEELNQRTAKMGRAERAEVFKKVFGTEASAGMLALADQANKMVDDQGKALVNSAGETTNALRLMLDKTNNYVDTASNIAKKQMNTTRGSLKELESAWQDAGISVGNLFLPAIRTASGGLKLVANAISAMTQRFPLFSKCVALAAGGVIAFTVATVALGLVSNAVRTGLNGVRGGLLRISAAHIRATATTAASTASTAAFGAASTLAGAGARFFAGGLRSILLATGVGALLVGIGYAINLLIDNWDEVVVAMRAAWAWVVDTWSRLGVFFTELGNNLTAIFAPIWGSICEYAGAARDLVMALWSGLADFFTSLWNAVSEGAAACWNGLVAISTWVCEGVVAVWTGISDFFTGLWQGVSDQSSWVFEGIMTIWNGAAEFFGGIVDSISSVFTAFFDWLAEKFSWVLSTIDTISGFVSKIGGAVSSAWDAAFGDDAPAKNANAAQNGSAAPNAQAAANKPATPSGQPRRTAPEGYKPGKFTPVPYKPEPEKPKKGKKSGGKRSGGGGRKSGGGGAGSPSSGSASASSTGGPVTVVTVGGDNSRPQTLFFPAGSAAPNAQAARSGAAAPTASSIAASGPSTLASTARTLATDKNKALPQTPERLKNSRLANPKAARETSVNLTQNFDLMAEDPQALKKILETIKPDFEALVRKALDKLNSNRSRTAYGQ